MVLHFETDYSGDIIKLTLKDEYNLIFFHFEFDRIQATDLVNLLNEDKPSGFVYAQKWTIRISKDSRGTVFTINDYTPFSRCEVLLSPDQTQDLASTLQMHIIASENETRPKDVLPPLDDAMNNPNWTPEKEKEAFGEGMDDSDNADWWKKGKR